jgi:putative component of toxin-antitoxin plasmid stabilization module
MCLAADNIHTTKALHKDLRHCKVEARLQNEGRCGYENKKGESIGRLRNNLGKGFNWEGWKIYYEMEKKIIMLEI